MVQKKSRRQMFDAYVQARDKAFDSRDKTLVRKQQKLEKELEKVEKDANETMDPKLRKEWKQAHREYCKLYFA
ncbi:MAG: hypothetical protein K8Q89_10235 [Nitrosarchaeum sp.]|nr:hypothetical protein [Nitrosarchaeum sp.]